MIGNITAMIHFLITELKFYNEENEAIKRRSTVTRWMYGGKEKTSDYRREKQHCLVSISYACAAEKAALMMIISASKGYSAQ